MVVFGIMKLTPGDPAEILLGENATEEAIMEIREQYALDEPIYVQYVMMMKNLFTGELKSIYYKENVISVVLSKLPATLELGLCALIIALVISIPAGIISAVKRNSIFDYVSMTTALFGVSIPVFYTGLLLMYVFAVYLKILPASGFNGHVWTAAGWKNFVLPSITLSFILMASTTRLTRSAMLEVISHDYIRTARSKGVKEKSVVMIHAFRNALIPVVTNVGNQIARLFAGAVLTETVFAWPGVGRLAVDAVFRRDEPLVFGTVLFMAMIYVVINLCVDLLYAVINPQITYD